MKKYLLPVLMLFGVFSNAQNRNDESCKAQFKYEINTMLMSPLPVTAVNFYDASEGEVVSWLWDFGEGNTSNEQNPLYVFDRPVPAPNVKINPYRAVSLTIFTADSCKSVYVDTINIMEGIPYNETFCNAGFKYYKAEYDSIKGTTSVQFTNFSVGDSIEYFWRFDSDQTSIEKDPLVIFSGNRNEYEVCLTVTGVNDCSSTFCDVVYINDPAECYTGFGYSINHEVQTFAPALVLDFYSKSEPEAIEWSWDFGDGTTSSEANPMHIFNLPTDIDSVLGDPNPFREVCLTVKTADGCVADYCETINIYMVDSTIVEPDKKCQAGFRYYQPTDLITIPEVVPFQFIDASRGDIISRLWEFEDGTTSTEKDPMKNFDFRQPFQKVCLTVTTADSCTSTWCETVIVNPEYTDTTITEPEKNYIMRYESGFPAQMSSCAGWVKAQVYLGDSVIDAGHYKWSHGVEGREANGFCPTQTYSVKAKTPDGTIVSGTFVFNADGTVTEIPISWWVSGQDDDQMIRYYVSDGVYSVEWKLCDGTVVVGDSIPLSMVNCDGQESNVILRDSLGNVVYSESLSKSIATSHRSLSNTGGIEIFPNPVKDVLNIRYTGQKINNLIIEVIDLSGKSMLVQNIKNIESGQNIGLNVNSLSKGIYVCKLISENELIGIEKFTK